MTTAEICGKMWIEWFSLQKICAFLLLVCVWGGSEIDTRAASSGIIDGKRPFSASYYSEPRERKGAFWRPRSSTVSGLPLGPTAVYMSFLNSYFSLFLRRCLATERSTQTVRRRSWPRLPSKLMGINSFVGWTDSLALCDFSTMAQTLWCCHLSDLYCPQAHVADTRQQEVLAPSFFEVKHLFLS